MKIILKLWILIFTIFLFWIYFIFLSPKIFNNSTLIVPDIINLEEDLGITILKEKNIKYKILYVENKEEVIIKTIPYAGTKIKSKNLIELYIGKIYPFKYSSYIGRLYSDVKDEIERLCRDFNLKLNISYEINNDYVSGVIVKESFIDGKTIEYGDVLNIIISKNDSTFLMPKFIGLSIFEAIALADEYNINLNLIYVETPIDEDIVVYQSTSENTLIQKNNQYQLDLYISKGIKDTTVINPNFFISILDNLGYIYELKYVKSNEMGNKLVAFEVQKLYDIGITKYILWIIEQE